MQEYIRKDRNGAELKIGERVNVHYTGKVIGSGEVKPPQNTSPWAHEEDIVWIEWETANREFEENIGHILWTWTTDIEKIIVKEEIKSAAPHVHAELIKMWADDPSIKFQCQIMGCDEWKDLIGAPVWNVISKYRVKPKEKKVVTKYKYSLSLTGNGILHTGNHYSDEEWIARLEKHPVKHFTKLEWTKKEFEVED